VIAKWSGFRGSIHWPLLPPGNLHLLSFLLAGKYRAGAGLNSINLNLAARGFFTLSIAVACFHMY
jgi:hypothetical protein